ncbi:hypothetical protein FSP39_013965 [Pinctada imbricata]|uniref:SLAIN motif-containing protein 2 n=1 Tax=Pinctada imbricata TaxID=66713 RepID=A0AA89BXE0_PINIB|nr:hypothetical protein FSP39_013965 [Pinctada imbricata]
MDPSDTIIDPQAEVKKLQDLVKKLEKQNEVLRGRQKLQLETLQNGEVEQGKLSTIRNNNISTSDINEKIKKKSISSLDDIDILDVENLSVKEDEDSWLYSSPKPPTPAQNRLSPYKWVRQEYEHPSPEVESARRSLINKLDEVARMSRSSSTPAFGYHSTPTSARSYSGRMSQSAENTPHRYQQPPARKLLANNMGDSSSRIDTGTFTRPKKSRDRHHNTEPDIAHQYQQPESRHDIVDVENLAKQQEESLRQSLTQSSPRRGIRPRQNIAPPNPVINNNIINSIDNSNSPIGSNRSSPARFEGDRRNSQTNSIGSDHSSPPDSPYGSQYLNNPSNENMNMRRSLPNVSQRLAPASGMYSSDPHLDNHSSGGSDDYEQQPYPQQRPVSRLQPPMRPMSPNVSGLRPPSTQVRPGLSPQRTGLPSPARRTIPRPGSTAKSGVPTPRRSIPSPRPTAAHRSDYSDESWKEGCF